MGRTGDSRCSTYEATPGAASAPLSPQHRARRPDQTLLYRLVAQQWPAFLDARQSGDPDVDGVPPFITGDVEGYLRCGILAHGFARVRCAACRTDTVVGFSCKSRGVCPSCTARRMHDVRVPACGWHLVDRVLPHIPMRQWVFTFPRPIRLAMFFDARLASEILGVCLRALFAWQRRLPVIGDLRSS